MSNKQIIYKRRITAFERMFTRSPYAIVTMVARIRGEISEQNLKNAILKIQQRHALLQVRISEDNNYVPWFTSENVQEIPIEIISRKNSDHWIEILTETYKIPFEFEKRPAIRFILVYSSQISELIIVCHHIICDGLSLAYLARDIMTYLGDPNLNLVTLPPPVPIDQTNIPKHLSLNRIIRFLIKRISEKWKAIEIYFDQEDYEELNKTYWSHYNHQMLSIELSETQTSELIEKCRKEKVTVNSAITAAFVGAQVIVQGENPIHSRIDIASSLRDRLQNPPGEAMGLYAGLVTLKHNYNPKLAFWENSRILHQKIQPLFTDKNLFLPILQFEYMEPAIMDSRNFKVLGHLIPPNSPRYQKIYPFSQRDDIVLSLLKRGNIDSIHKMFMGTAVTNLTKLPFPTKYGALELDRLIMNPGGGFPLATVNLVLGAVTCAGKLSLIMEYAESTVDSKTMRKIKEKALELLLTSD